MLNFKPAVGGVAFALFKTPLLHMFWQFGAMAIMIIAAYILFIKENSSLSDRKKIEIATLLIIAGFILVMIPQFVYFKDIYFYQNPPFARANTVFKIWYAAWPLLAIGSATLTVFAVNGFKKRNTRIVGWVCVALVCMILGYGTVRGVDSLRDQQPNSSKWPKLFKAY